MYTTCVLPYSGNNHSVRLLKSTLEINPSPLVVLFDSIRNFCFVK